LSRRGGGLRGGRDGRRCGIEKTRAGYAGKRREAGDDACHEDQPDECSRACDHVSPYSNRQVD
jgi:hypothetical protein